MGSTGEAPAEREVEEDDDDDDEDEKEEEEEEEDGKEEEKEEDGKSNAAKTEAGLGGAGATGGSLESKLPAATRMHTPWLVMQSMALQGRTLSVGGAMRKGTWHERRERVPLSPKISSKLRSLRAGRGCSCARVSASRSEIIFRHIASSPATDERRCGAPGPSTVLLVPSTAMPRRSAPAVNLSPSLSRLPHTRPSMRSHLSECC